MTGWYFIKHYQMINICRIIKIKTCIPLFALHFYDESNNDSQYLKKTYVYLIQWKLISMTHKIIFKHMVLSKKSFLLF